MKVLTADFPGAAFPPETKVAFTIQTGDILNGTVQKLFPRYARVTTEEGTIWNVPYRLLKITEVTQVPAMSLAEIQTLGHQLLREHEVKSGLESGWQFGFDLAPSRGGICKYNEKQLSLSITYCLRASKAEIIDTILHEIAHAIVGHRHGHDAVWKAAAARIGCTAERCHRVKHTLPRWQGRCGCEKKWERQRLTRRTRTWICTTCRNKIIWKQIG